MKVTMHRAFNYIVIKNTFEHPNEETENHQWANGPVDPKDVDAIWVTTEGLSILTDVNTNVVEEYHVGDFTPEVPTPGLWKFTAGAYPTTVYCLESKSNEGLDIKTISKFTLLQGNNVTLPQGTKLFLAAGDVVIDGTTHTGPKQIKLSSGEKQLTATSNSYGLLFP